jgi:hypothetical protein
MAEAKKTGTKRARSTQKADLVEMAAASAAEAIETAADTKPASQPAAPKTEPAAAGILLSSIREQGETFRRAMGEAASVSAKGALEVNGKIIEALNTQGNAALDLWRSTLGASALPEAFQAQTSATRLAYETASAQWKDIAETTARWVTSSLEPLQSALHRQAR